MGALPPLPSLGERASGVLLHPTSLDAPHGLGDLGTSSRRFVDFLSKAGQRWWQILPLGPPATGASPYLTLSALARNPMLIGYEGLVYAGLVREEELPPPRASDGSPIDYPREEAERARVWALAFERFDVRAHDREALEAFSRDEPWVQDFALFCALKQAHGGAPFNAWPRALATRQPAAIAEARRALAREVRYHAFLQLELDRQWRALRRYAHERGVAILGDAPIFVAHDSADVWAHPELFHLREDGSPRVVAGVPPDYFSATGQRWGNALYDWEAHAKDGYAWWRGRVRTMLSQMDAFRLDHFIGFVRAWEIPEEHTTAEGGRFVAGPGRALFDALAADLGALPLVAEDLGLVTPEVEALRDGLDLPGMRILQFSFAPSRGADPTRPHAYPQRSVAYTGTHDNDTLRGWLEDPSQEGEGDRARAVRAELAFARAYVEAAPALPIDEQCWRFVRAVWASPSRLAIVPMQDLLALGTEARMNVPGTTEGNWRWRMKEGEASDALAEKLRALSDLYARTPRPFV